MIYLKELPIVLLPAEDSRLHKGPSNYIFYPENVTVKNSGYHMYILSNEEITQKDIDSKKWYLVRIDSRWAKESLATFNEKDILEDANRFEARLIVATTNPKLIADGIAGIDEQDILQWAETPAKTILVSHNRMYRDLIGEVYSLTDDLLIYDRESFYNDRKFYTLNLTDNNTVITKPASKRLYTKYEMYKAFRATFGTGQYGLEVFLNNLN